MEHAENIKILIGCECSGRVREAFLSRGFDAWSCDLQPCETQSNRHIQDDIRHVLEGDWDMLAVMHPPCTRLCNSGVRWLHTPPPGKTKEQMWAELQEGAALFSSCWNAKHIPHRAIENPVMHKHAKALIENFAPAAQTVQPHWFGEKAFKATGLYLNRLPKLIPTNRLETPASGTPEHKAWSAIHRAPPGPDRAKFRSRTFQGIADAFADQWGSHLLDAIQP